MIVARLMPVAFLLLILGVLGNGCGRDNDGAVTNAGEVNVFRQGERLFQRYCQHCHQSHGQGMAGTFPPLATSTLLHGDPWKPIAIVLLGLQGPIERDGIAYNGVMPGLAERMSDSEIAAVLSHVRKRWGEIEEPVSSELVSQVREELGGRRALWTESELLHAYRSLAARRTWVITN